MTAYHADMPRQSIIDYCLAFPAAYEDICQRRSAEAIDKAEGICYYQLA
jgi:hypothetical protein